jgi:hypothetical protein
MVFLPFAAPSTGAFIENSPLGARQGCRASAEGQEPLLLTLDKSEERRKQAATGRLFFGYFLFDCMDAGGRATQEQLPRRSKRK